MEKTITMTLAALATGRELLHKIAVKLFPKIAKNALEKCLKTYLLFRQMVDTLQTLMTKTDENAIGQLPKSEFACDWNTLLGDLEVIRALLWTSDSKETPQNILLALAQKNKTLFIESRSIFIDKAISEGFNDMLTLLRDYGDCLSNDNHIDEEALLSGTDFKAIEEAVSKGRQALSLMEKEMSLALK